MNKIALRIKDKYVRLKKTLCLAESCTGGLIGNLLTDVSGSSEYFAGGIIAYSNEAKIKILGVSRKTIAKFGAVSEHTAKEMAICARKLFSSAAAVAVTGIAGPGGGSKEKPVGLVYIAAVSGGKIICRKFIFKGSRLKIKEQSANEALKIVCKVI